MTVGCLNTMQVCSSIFYIVIRVHGDDYINPCMRLRAQQAPKQLLEWSICSSGQLKSSNLIKTIYIMKTSCTSLYLRSRALFQFREYSSYQVQLSS